MDVSEEERKKSSQLSAGYDQADQTWEFVIKYSGSEDALNAFWPRPIVFLYNQYAISRGTSEEIERLASNPQVEWIEKPKQMEYEVLDGIRASCINAVRPPEAGLTGNGILIAVIDSGIDIFHPDFRKDDGTTRILGLWDQTQIPVSMTENDRDQSEVIERNIAENGEPPEGYYGGVFYSQQEINEALRAGEERGIVQGRQIVSSQDVNGHGTHVAGIAAGNGRASGGRLKGVAPEADLLIVKLGVPGESDFPRTTQVMTGIDFAVRFAMERNLPLVINLSIGNNYGAHDGTTLLETYMNQIMGLGKITIVTGMGNQGTSEKHTSHVLQEGEELEIPFIIGPGEQSFGLQIWKNYADVIRVSLLHPSGEILGPFYYGFGLTETGYGDTRVLVYNGEPVPYSVNQEIYITFLPEEESLDEGEWRVLLESVRIVSGQVELWLPDAGLISGVTKFLKPDPVLTQTIPSTADRVISVGAYDALTNRIAPFSGRGTNKVSLIRIKPDLVAPGVNIESCAPGGGYTIKSGTSMAVPFVSGSAALMMEWGIGKGNDIFLYGEKLKAYLRRGARQLPGFTEYPNEVTGYGKLCLADSFPDGI